MCTCICTCVCVCAEDGKIYCFDLSDETALAHAHECRVAARQHKLYLIAYQYSIGLPRPHGTEAAKHVAWTKAGESGAGAMAVEEETHQHAPITQTGTYYYNIVCMGVVQNM
jgi:hypothetical protein